MNQLWDWQEKISVEEKRARVGAWFLAVMEDQDTLDRPDCALILSALGVGQFTIPVWLLGIRVAEGREKSERAVWRFAYGDSTVHETTLLDFYRNTTDP
jgi:hypothetical protein